jgi:hypothetical protein
VEDSQADSIQTSKRRTSATKGQRQTLYTENNPGVEYSNSSKQSGVKFDG